MMTLITLCVFIAAVITKNTVLSYGLMIWFLIVGLKSISYILLWNKKENAQRTALTTHLAESQAAEKIKRRTA